MKPFILLSLLVLGSLLPWACSNSAPTGPLATYNLTSTFTYTVTSTPTNWAGYTSTNTPSGPTNTQTSTSTCTNTQTSTSTMQYTATPTQTCTSTSTFAFPTPVLTQSPFTCSLPPNGVAYDGSSNVYVAEGTDGQSGGKIEVFNATSGSLVNTLTTYDGTHSFGQPNGLVYTTISSTPYLFVVDQYNNALYQVNLTTPASSAALTSWTGAGPDSFLGPEGIAIDGSGLLYIADTGNDEVEVFTPGSLISNGMASTGAFNGSTSGTDFNNPSAVAIDNANSYIYVADASNQRVVSFNLSGYGYHNQFSTSSSSDVYGLTVDGSGHVYTADVGQGAVQEFDGSGDLLTAGLGLTATNPSPDGLVFIGSNLLISDYTNSELYLVSP